MGDIERVHPSGGRRWRLGHRSSRYRKSTYDNPEYQKAAPFAAVILKAMQTADPTNPAIKPVPYIGVQFAGIPEFQAIGTEVGQNISAALAGKETVEQALKASQNQVERAMKQGGYLK